MMNKSMWTFSWLVVAATAYLLIVGSLALEVEETKLPCERLPLNVVPVDYQLELQFPNFHASSYSGEVTIALRFPLRVDKEKERNVEAFEELVKGLKGEVCKLDNFGPNTIVLHADKSIELEDIAVSTESCGFSCFGGAGGEKSRNIRSVKRDSEKQLIAIKLRKGVNAGTTGQMSIKFRSKFRADKRGVYVSSYRDGDKEYKHIVSQFQPTDARLVFPVFDEPRFKVPFQVRLVHPQGLTSLSNTEVDTKDTITLLNEPLTRTTFKWTPQMAVHMVAFTVGEFDAPLEIVSNSTVGKNSYKVRVFTEPGKRESGQFAFEVAKDSLKFFEKYINFHYPLEKFDLVAIADHDKDNTESWGLSFIRNSLVWIDDETKPDTRITTAVNVAHVCVHQWFGNLVTAAWWNDLWITEGVAAQFAFRIVRELYPEFQSEYFVRLATLSGVMQLDAPGKLHALSPQLDELRTSEHIYALFDNVEFMKSASLAQMISKLLAESQADWYQKLLRKLVNDFAYMSIDYADYTAALKNSIEDRVPNKRYVEMHLMQLIEYFEDIRGVLLVNVHLAGIKLNVDVELMHEARKDVNSISQKQSTLAIIYDDILIEYGSEWLNKMIGKGFTPDLGFSSATNSWFLMADPKFVKIGSYPDIHTYYRTRYSDSIYEGFGKSIVDHELTAMDRLQLLDDATALVQAQLIKNDTFRQFVDCFANEEHGAVLLELMVALQTLEGLVTTDKSPSLASQAILNIFEKYGFSVTGEESFLEQRSRSVGLKALIKRGNQQVIEAALKTFDEANGKVALFLRDPVYSAVAMFGSEEQRQALWEKYYKTRSYEEKIRLKDAIKLRSWDLVN